MPIDRGATLRQAEKLLRQGKLDQAITEYERLVDDQPREWNTCNVLGDLLVQAGRTERAVEQLIRVADGFLSDGYLLRALAVYKRILKLQPDSDHALMQAGELAAKQTLLRDARAYFGAALDGRRKRGDTQGLWRIVARMGALDPNDIEARLASAGARVELGETDIAVRELCGLADMLIETRRELESLVPLREIARLEPTNIDAVTEVTRILVAHGRYGDLASFITPELLAIHPTLLLAAASARLRQGQTDVALQMMGDLLEPGHWNPSAIGELAASVADLPDVAYTVVDRAVSACTSRRDWSAAFGVLKQFLVKVPSNITALTRLVDVCAEGSMPDDALEAQGRLADAYLASGSVDDARRIAEDLLALQPWEHRNAVRMRAVFEASGEASPDDALSKWIAARHTFGVDPNERVRDDSSQHLLPPADPVSETPVANVQTDGPDPRARPRAASQPPAQSKDRHAIDVDALLAAARTEAPRRPAATLNDRDEVDLSFELDEIRPQAAPDHASAPPDDIEQVFADMRGRLTLRPDDSADVTFLRGKALMEAGDLESGADALRVAARSPRRQFASALLLAQICRQTSRLSEAVEWLGRAVEAPAPTPRERFDALLGLADLLEASGEPERALAVCLELQADAGDYKDVAARLTRLSGAQAGG